MMRFAFLGILAVVVAAPSGAAVLDSSPAGFTISVERKLGPDSAEARQALWALLIAPDRWWSSAHSWSGDASNMVLDPAVGGCWCEKLKDGGRVEHARVIAVEPQRRLLLRGSLGPLQNLAVTGVLDWSMGEKAGATTLTLRYAVGGYGLGNTAAFAKGVDGVLSEQVDRLVAAAAR
jgi:hypothetical protein